MASSFLYSASTPCPRLCERISNFPCCLQFLARFRCGDVMCVVQLHGSAFEGILFPALLIVLPSSASKGVFMIGAMCILCGDVLSLVVMDQ